MRSLILAGVVAVAAADRAMVGTNIGGWQVIEPWITPSLFYRFLGKTHSEGVGIDQFTLCEALGETEGNAVLREHWDTWITEETFAEMAAREVEIIRIPIGDWTLKPYGPYVGCTEGAADKVQWALDQALAHGIKVLLDVHCVKGSQNGFDNSGLANRTEWLDENNFSHRAIGEWMGKWDTEQGKYSEYYSDNIEFAKDTIRGLLDQWGTHEALYAIEPVNEPWWNSDLGVLKDFYRDVRDIIRSEQPRLKFVFHDSFHWDPLVWNDLFEDDDHENVVMDTHQYYAWDPAHGPIMTYCTEYETRLAVANAIKYDVWVGEWSLATDVCALWLGGFNDANTDAVHECQRVDCPISYMPVHGVDFDRTADILGPFGDTGKDRDHATIKQGKCAIDSARFNDDDVMKLGQCTLSAFNRHVQGQFMWTVRNELEDRWNYVTSYDKGWIKNQAIEEPQEFLQ